MKSDTATAEKIADRDLLHLIDLHAWLRITGDRHHTLALIPTGLSKQGWQRLADFCAKMAS